jgi:hypothetical protein
MTAPRPHKNSKQLGKRLHSLAQRTQQSEKRSNSRAQRPRPLPGFHRTRYFDDRDLPTIEEILTSDKYKSNRDKAARLRCSPDTVRRFLKARRAGKPLLSAGKRPAGAVLRKPAPAGADPVKRLQFCKTIKARHLELVRASPNGVQPFYVFQDESWIWARSYKKGQFVAKGSKNPDAPRKGTFVPKVNTMGLLTEKSFRTYDMPTGNVGFAQFFDVLKKAITPLLPTWRRQAGKRPIVFIMDNAPTHGVLIGSRYADERAGLVSLSCEIKSGICFIVVNALAVFACSF